jgi:hypothetical protein
MARKPTKLLWPPATVNNGFLQATLSHQRRPYAGPRTRGATLVDRIENGLAAGTNFFLVFNDR